MQLGNYSFMGKTAPDYFNLAKSCYDKSYLIDAINYMKIAKEYSRPVNDFFEYKKEKEMQTFKDKIVKEANEKYILPIVLDKIDSKPSVFCIIPKMIDEGFFPMVCYLTNIKLTDTIALKSENEKIKKIIGQIFTGIDKDKKYIFYQAFNEIPDEKSDNQPNGYGFVEKFKE